MRCDEGRGGDSYLVVCAMVGALVGTPQASLLPAVVALLQILRILVLARLQLYPAPHRLGRLGHCEGSSSGCQSVPPSEQLLAGRSASQPYCYDCGIHTTEAVLAW